MSMTIVIFVRVFLIFYRYFSSSYELKHINFVVKSLKVFFQCFYILQNFLSS